MNERLSTPRHGAPPAFTYIRRTLMVDVDNVVALDNASLPIERFSTTQELGHGIL